MPRPFGGQMDNMDTRAIRQVACSPYRLSRAFRGKATVKLVSRVILLDHGLDGPPPQYAVYLLPGGRWLLHTDRGTCLDDGSPSRLSCSDLSIIAVVQPSLPLYLEHAAETWPTLYHVQSDPENHRIVVIVSYLGTFPTYVLEIQLRKCVFLNPGVL